MAMRKKKSKKPDKPLWLLDREETEEEDYIAAPKSQVDLAREHEENAEEVEASQNEAQSFLQTESPEMNSTEEQQQTATGLENFIKASTDLNKTYGKDGSDLINHVYNGSDLDMTSFTGTDMDPANFGYHLDPMEYIRYFKASIKRARLSGKSPSARRNSSKDRKKREVRKRRSKGA